MINKQTHHYPLLFTVTACLLGLFLSCQSGAVQEQKGPLGPYFSIQPTDTPQLLVPEHIAAPLTAYNGTFSSDGNILLYTLEVAGRGIIMETYMKQDSSWTQPTLAMFSGEYSDYDPLFSPDGTRLYFSSQRPVSEEAKGGKSHIWYVKRKGKNWTVPRLIRLTDQGDYYSSLTRGGEIYFNIWDTGDIYKASSSDTGWVKKALPEAINGREDVGDPFVSPDESYLIFRGYFKEGMGRGDLYISFREEDTWSQPIPLPAPINSSGHEMCPWVSPDQKIFTFASDRLSSSYELFPGKSQDSLVQKSQSIDNGNHNVYFMSAAFIAEMRQKHLERE
jgi:hypothetical protein